MNWYVTSLLVSRRRTGGDRSTGRQCQRLIEAPSAEAAYNRALELGGHEEADAWSFVGIVDLLLVHEQPSDGSELLWSESEMGVDDLRGHVLDKDNLRAFRKSPAESAWYIGSIVLREVHDVGSHGSLWLVWTNSYLVRASSPEGAYAKINRIGEQQQDAPGSHTCGGESAHWEFEGVHDIIPVREVPGDGSLLWCDELTTAADRLKDLIPTKSELAVFRWEAEQAARRSS